MITPKYFFNGKLFVNSFKRNWAFMLVVGIIMFFFGPIAALMYFNNESSIFWENLEKTNYSQVLENAYGMGIVASLMAAAFGVIAALTVSSYMNKLPSSYFYHSMPIKREALFLTNYLAGTASFAAAYFVNAILSILIISINVPVFGAVSGIIIVAFLKSLLWFSVFYSITWFAGMLSGLSIIQLIMAGVTVFILPVFYLLGIVWLNDYTSAFNVDYYLENLTVFEKLTPVVRMFTTVDRPLSALEVLYYIAMTLFFIVVAMLVYKKREAGRAEKPIVFKPVASVIKYLAIIVGTIIFGYIFKNIASNFRTGWMIFGYFCGAMLVFMLMNTILNKNFRDMFKGIKGLGIYGIVFVVILIAMPAVGRGLDNYIPLAVSRVELIVSGDSYIFDDKECIDAVKSIERLLANDDENYYIDDSGEQLILNELYNIGYVPSEEEQKYIYGEYFYPESEDYIVYPDGEVVYDYDTKYIGYYSDNWSNAGTRVQIVYRNLIGMPIAKTYYSQQIAKEKIESELKILANSQDLKDMYASANAENFTRMQTRFFVFENGAYYNSYLYAESERDNMYGYGNELAMAVPVDYYHQYGTLKMDMLLKENAMANLANRIDFDYFQNPNCGNVEFYGGIKDAERTAIHLTSAVKLTDYLNDVSNYTENADDNPELAMTADKAEEMADIFDCIVVYKRGGKHIQLENKAEMTEVISALSSYGNNASFFTVSDSDYIVMLKLTRVSGEDTYTQVIKADMIKGKVPDFVLSALE